MPVTFKPLKSLGDPSAKVITGAGLAPNREVYSLDERVENKMSGH